MAAKPSPRNLPKASRKGVPFKPRRSYARARASKDRIEALRRLERNQQSQAKFARNLKLTINIGCIIAIAVLLFYIIFLSPKPKAEVNPEQETSETR